MARIVVGVGHGCVVSNDDNAQKSVLFNTKEKENTGRRERLPFLRNLRAAADVKVN
jgi:hypothetical protein